jgi:outer membrane receptor for ferrienterochelin and colicin
MLGTVTLAFSISASAFSEDFPVDQVTAPSTKADDKQAATATVEVTGGRELGVRQASVVNKTVFRNEELTKYGDAHLTDALRRMPGLTVENMGDHQEIRFRGLGTGYTQILIDGQPAPRGFSIDSLPPEIVERVELYRSASAEFSAQAIAGTINIILKQKPGSSQRSLETSVTRQRDHLSPRINLNLAGEAGILSYSVSGAIARNEIDNPATVVESGTDSSGTPFLSRSAITPTRGHAVESTLAPQLNWNIGENNKVSLNSFLNHVGLDMTNSERYTTALGPPPEYTSDFLGLHQTINSANNDLTWQRKFDDGTALENKVGFGYARRTLTGNFTGYDENAVLVLDRHAESYSADRTLTLAGKVSTPVVTNHAFAVGWDGSYSRRNESRVQNDITPTGRLPWNTDENYDADVTRHALFARDEWDITPRLSAYLGLRWERLTTSTEGTGIRSVRNSFSVWSPMLQTVWKIPNTEADQFRLGLARTYRAPDTSDLVPRRAISNNNSQTNPDARGNPELRPELSWGLDAAFEHYIGKQGLLSLTAYERHIDDVLLRQLYRDVQWISVPVNAGKARVRGVELEVKLPLSTYAESLNGADFKFAMARNWSRVDAIEGPNNRLAAQTPFSAQAALDYQVPGLPVATGLAYTFRRGGLVRTSATEGAYTSAQRNLSAYALWKVDKQWQLRATVDNAAAGDAINQSLYYGSDATISRTTILPAALSFGLNLTRAF